MSNPNDLVIVRRGDIEALKQEAIFGVFRREAVEFDKLNALLSNAPVVSSEPIGWFNNIGVFINNGIKQIRVLRGESAANDFNIPIYTTPQQPQSVADALEEALTIALEYTQYSYERRQITNRIRALIKRNADGVE